MRILLLAFLAGGLLLHTANISADDIPTFTDADLYKYKRKSDSATEQSKNDLPRRSAPAQKAQDFPERAQRLYIYKNGGDGTVLKIPIDESGRVIDEQHDLKKDVPENAYQKFQDALIKASLEGNIQKVRELVSQGVNINERGTQNYSALYISAARRHREVVTFLLSRGADVESPTSDYGYTPLMAAAQNGWEDIVEIMISKGAKVNARTINGVTALSQASAAGNENIVRLLIQHGTDLPSLGRKALLEATNAGHKDIVELLLSKGANMDPSEKEPKTVYQSGGGIVATPGSIVKVIHHPLESPLRAALWKKNEAIALVLIDKGAVIDEKGAVGDPLLLMALKGGMFNAARALVKRGADVNELKDGYPLISHFIAYGKSKENVLDAISFLCDYGADIERRPLRSGSTPLMIAASKGDQQIVGLLLSHGANINARYIDPPGYASSDQGATAFGFAAREGHMPIVELLLSKGADVTLKKTNGYTPLIDAINFGHRRVAKMLIANNADVNAETIDHINPLMSALKKKDLQIAQLLIDKGADVNSKSMKGYFHFLIAKKDFESVKFIADNGFNINEPYDGTTPLYYASQEGANTCVELLLAHKANVNSKDRLGRTPLMAASENGHISTVKLLLANGADINAADPSGQSAFILAKQKGHSDIAQYLSSKGADTTVYSKQLELITLMKKKGFIPADAKADELAPQNLEYIRLSLKAMGIENLEKWKPDIRYSSPEKTWEHYRQALLKGDFDTARKCHAEGIELVDVYKNMEKETMRDLVLKMRSLEKIEADDRQATYRLVITKKGNNISYEVTFINMFGEWKILNY